MNRFAIFRFWLRAQWLNFWLRFAMKLWVFLLYCEAWWAYLVTRKIKSFWHIGPAVAARIELARVHYTKRVESQSPAAMSARAKAEAKRERKRGR